MKNMELVKRIIDCLSDGYDDEEWREDAENHLSAELENLESDSYIIAALRRLCQKVEEFEM